MPISSPYQTDGVPGSVNRRLKASSMPSAVAAQHRGEATADAALVELHGRLRPARLVDLLAFEVTQTPEVDLVVVA